jgi:hypothetical protein
MAWQLISNINGVAEDPAPHLSQIPPVGFDPEYTWLSCRMGQAIAM